MGTAEEGQGKRGKQQLSALNHGGIIYPWRIEIGAQLCVIDGVERVGLAHIEENLLKKTC